MTNIFGFQAPNYTTAALTLELSLGHSSRLEGAHFLFGKAQAVIWGHGPNAPRGAGPAATH